MVTGLVKPTIRVLTYVGTGSFVRSLAWGIQTASRKEMARVAGGDVAVYIEFDEPVTDIDGLGRRLSDRRDTIFQVVSHADQDGSFTDAWGSHKIVSARLARMARGSGAKVVLATTCFGAEFAKALVEAQATNLAIGYSEALSAGAAIQFSRGFYRSLVQGKSLGRAIRDGALFAEPRLRKDGGPSELRIWDRTGEYVDDVLFGPRWSGEPSVGQRPRGGSSSDLLLRTCPRPRRTSRFDMRVIGLRASARDMGAAQEPAPGRARAPTSAEETCTPSIRVLTYAGAGHGIHDLAQAIRGEVSRELVGVDPTLMVGVIEFDEPVTDVDGLARRLADGRDTILHLVSHASASGAITIKDIWGNLQLSPETLARMVKSNRIKVVLAHTCHGAEIVRALGEANAAGVAIGYTEPLSAGVAVQFSRGFYRSLVQGHSLGKAIADGALIAKPLVRRHGGKTELRIWGRPSEYPDDALFGPSSSDKSSAGLRPQGDAGSDIAVREPRTQYSEERIRTADMGADPDFPAMTHITLRPGLAWLCEPAPARAAVSARARRPRTTTRRTRPTDR